MTVARNAIQLGVLLATGTMLASAIMAARAMAADSIHPASEQAASPACKAARQDAWFARQLRMTEGDKEPLQPPEPAACAPMGTAPGEPGHGSASAAKPVKERR